MPNSDLTLGLKHYWTFDSKSGPDVWQDTGPASAGTDFEENVHDSISQVTGKIGNAVQFNLDDTEFLEAADALTMRADQGSFAVGFWFRMTDVTVAQQNIVHKSGAVGALIPEWRIYFRGPTKTLRFTINFPSGTREVVLLVPTLEPDEWNYVAAIFEQGVGLRIVFNPTPTSLTERFLWTETPVDYGAQYSPLRIGGDEVTSGMLGGGGPFDGAIDELAIWQGDIPDGQDFWRIYNEGEGLPFEEWAASETECVSDTCCPPDPYEYQSVNATESGAGTNFECEDVIVNITPPSGSMVYIPSYVVLGTDNSFATIRYTTDGSEPTALSALYTTPFQITVGGTVVKARAFLGQCSPGPIAVATYVSPPFPIGMAYACDTPDNGGTWGVFAPNGTVDNHWQTVFTLSALTTIKRLEMYQVAGNGQWTTGIVWSTDSPITIDGESFEAMPLLLFIAAVQQHFTYQSSLGAFAAATHTWDLYGDRQFAAGGFFRLDFILNDDSRVSGIVNATCSGTPPVPCPSPAAPTVTPKCDGAVDVTFAGAIGQNYKVNVSQIGSPSGYIEVASGTIAASPTTVEVSGLVKGALYYFQVGLEYNCGGGLRYQYSIGVPGVPLPDPSVSISSDKLEVDPNESFTISWDSLYVGGAVCGGCLDGQVSINQGLGCKAGNTPGSQATSQAVPGDYTYEITGCNTCGTEIASVVVRVRNVAACSQPQAAQFSIANPSSVLCPAPCGISGADGLICGVTVWNGVLVGGENCVWGAPPPGISPFFTGGCVVDNCGPRGFGVSVQFDGTKYILTMSYSPLSGGGVVLWQGEKLFGQSPAGVYTQTGGCASGPATITVS